MNELRIGVIGAGRIGLAHISRMNGKLAGARVTAVASSSLARAGQAAAALSIPRAADAEAIIDSPEIDAIVLASPAASHEQYVLRCMEQGKPLFCEKPLAVTADGCLAAVRAECAAKRRLIQLGFMRRFDRDHLELRGLIEGGSLGRPLMIHAVHRNPDVPDFTDELEIMDAAIHELDALPWLLGNDPITHCQVLCGAPAAAAAGRHNDPMLVLARTAAGVLIDIEVFTHCSYGFDIGCEIVCERGTAALPSSTSVLVRQNAARSTREYGVWSERYYHAFGDELQYFIDSVHRGAIGGPSAWDGYLSTLTGEACLRSIRTGAWEGVSPVSRPALYD